MTELLIFWSTVMIIALLLAVLRDVHDDGYGRRQPPPSHHPDVFDPSLRLNH